VLQDLDWPVIARGYAVVAILGVLMVALSVRSIRRYD
jgi:ABC-2 type transport system permease protein